MKFYTRAATALYNVKYCDYCFKEYRLYNKMGFFILFYFFFSFFLVSAKLRSASKYYVFSKLLYRIH